MLIGKYAGLAECFGVEFAERAYKSDIERAKKEDKIRRLKEKLTTMPAEDVGAAYRAVIAFDLGSEQEELKTETAWRVQNAILTIRVLEMEI